MFVVLSIVECPWGLRSGEGIKGKKGFSAGGRGFGPFRCYFTGCPMQGFREELYAYISLH